jgi:hypothetical protein
MLTLTLKKRFEDWLKARTSKAENLEQVRSVQDPGTIREWHKLACFYQGKGDKRQATMYKEWAFEGALYELGLDSPETLVLMSNLTEYYDSHGTFQALIKLRQKIYQHLETPFGS